MPVLVVAEHGPAGLAPVTARTVTAALAFGPAIDVLVAGDGCRPAAEESATLAGVARVRLAEGKSLAGGLAEPLAALIADLAAGYDAVLVPATTTGKNVLPRAAALLDAAPVTDVVEIVQPGVYVRPIYAGNALATVESAERPQLLTVRPAAFPAAEPSGQPAPIEPVPAPPAWPRTRVEKPAVAAASGRPDLAAARVVIAGGRGLGSVEQFAALHRLAEQLGGAVGASRAAVDLGFIANEFQIGQTGKIVAPDLYIAVGISGAIQHVAGMRDSGVVVAINTDENAPIFENADFAWVEDLFTALPELEAALARLAR